MTLKGIQDLLDRSAGDAGAAAGSAASLPDGGAEPWAAGVAVGVAGVAPEAGSWSNASLQECEDKVLDGVYCPRTHDQIMCWPPTPANTLAVKQCFAEFNGVKYDPTGIVTRLCHANGTWAEKTNYTLCKDILVLGPEGDAQGVEDWSVELTSMLYQVGYALSLVALFFAVLIFISFKDLHCLRNVIHTNLMCAYILADFTWILTNSIQTSQPEQCLSLLVLFHYFYLTTFTWMFVEGLYLYILVVETFTRHNVRLRCYVLIGWGSPMLFVALWVLARCLSPTHEHEGSHAESQLLGVCTWMLPHWSDWFYQAPALVVLGVNSVFLIVIMWVLITKLRSATSLETQQSRKATKALLVLIPLLGMTYVLTMAAPPDGATGAAVYAALRAGLLSTQGLSVALLYCFLNAEVRRALHHRWHRWRESRDLAARPCPACAKDWSPRSRTESIRLYCPPATTGSKRESTASQSTTTTLLGPHQVHHQATEHTV